MKLLKALNKSFKKLDKKMVLLLLACVCLVVIGVYYLKKQKEGFSDSDDVSEYYPSKIKNSITNFTANDKEIWLLERGEKYVHRRSFKLKIDSLGNKTVLFKSTNKDEFKEITSIDLLEDVKKYEINYADNSDKSEIELLYIEENGKYKDIKKLSDNDDLSNKIISAIDGIILPPATTPPATTPPATTPSTFTYTGDVSQVDCIKQCLDADVENNVCFQKCDEWNNQEQKELETCKFNPGGVTPLDCKTRCEEYYNIVDPENTTCINSCESKCNSCNSSRCKWLQYGDVTEFPYKLSIFGVPGNGKVTVNWEKPPYDVKKYIIMYFEEEKQNESGVSFIEVYGNECTGDKYCTYTITGLTNNKNYVIGVSIIFQNDNITRTSERLVLRPEPVVQQLTQTEQQPDTLTPSNSIQTRTPSQILTNALRVEQSRARTQKIIRDFRESEEDHISSLFSYLAKSPINLEFKLS